MNLGLLGIFGNLLLEGIKLFGEERKASIYKKHYNAIKYLDAVKNRNYNSSPQYTDIDVNLAQKDLEAFVISYAPMLGEEIEKIIKAGVWPPK